MDTFRKWWNKPKVNIRFNLSVYCKHWVLLYAEWLEQKRWIAKSTCNEALNRSAFTCFFSSSIPHTLFEAAKNMIGNAGSYCNGCIERTSQLYEKAKKKKTLLCQRCVSVTVYAAAKQVSMCQMCTRIQGYSCCVFLSWISMYTICIYDGLTCTSRRKSLLIRSFAIKKRTGHRLKKKIR